MLEMPSEATKHTFVLVHGAWHGGWCWRRVSDLLTARGHEVFAPTLTGVGERAHLLSLAIGLDTHIADIVNVFEFEGIRDAVLVGHSYGGMVVTGVAERLPGRIKSIVYLDAFVPADNQSMLDIVSEERRKQLGEAAAKSGGLSVPPIPAAVFNVNAVDQAWVDSKCTVHPFKTMTDKVRTTGARERTAKKAYVRAADYPSPYFSMIYDKLNADPAWRAYALPCGHDVMVDMPERLTEILEEVA
jgi:pimeloyl-ACP methyl ester carboxylesterase